MEAFPTSVLKIRSFLLSKNYATLRGVTLIFKSYDDNRDKKLTKQEVFLGLQDFGLNLTNPEKDEAFAFIDKSGDGSISFEEFLTSVRGPVSAAKQNMIDQAFLKLDKDGSGAITKEDLKGTYSCHMHPKFKNGQQTEEQIFNDFVSQFGDKNSDNKIAKKEWNDYYAGVAANFDNEQHFVDLMKNTWKL